MNAALNLINDSDRKTIEQVYFFSFKTIEASYLTKNQGKTKCAVLNERKDSLLIDSREPSPLSE
ncbi:TPA: hypothetical protein JBD88_02560 [Legionella pneumophila subsp. pneumophila]|nr:protein of unknown function [Legionella pneumophila subsp. pneumophila]HAT8057214.1 hypothetical protein [Legionella pneumophila]HAT8059758.1 hypothetical protein [Legionella pneumophila]HAT8252714.1 hypothetical protein [Legionella pneumophila]HAT8277871.1 hypothetical protein [Legionella pneumophila]